MENYFEYLLPKPKHIEKTEGRIAVSSIRYFSLPGEYKDYTAPYPEWLPQHVSVSYDMESRSDLAGLQCLSDALGEEEYILHIDIGKIVIRIGGWRGLLYALYTLSDLVAFSEGLLPCGKIHDYPDMAIRAFHFDCRVQHPTVAHMEMWIGQLSKFRCNMIILEYESHYPYRKHRILNAPDAYTENDIHQILKFACDRGIEIVPCLQTFAHVEHILKLTVFRHLTESRGLFTDSVVQVCPCHPGALSLFKDLIGELAAAHPSPYIHIGADETIKLGYCDACADIVKRSGKGYLFSNYMNQVAQLVLDAGKKPIIWADIAMEYPETLDMISKDTVLIYWNYANEKAEEFVGANKLRHSGYRFWIAPAALSYPDSSPLAAAEVAFRHHDRNIRAAVEAVALYEGNGIVTTAWSVDGDFAYLRSGWEHIDADIVHPNAIYGMQHNVRRFVREATMPFIAAGSLYAWNKEDMDERFISRFEFAVFCDKIRKRELKRIYEQLENRDYDGALKLLSACPSNDAPPFITALTLMAECGKLDREFHSLCSAYDDSDSFYQQAAAFKLNMQQTRQRFFGIYADWFGPREADIETRHRFLKYEKEFESI